MRIVDKRAETRDSATLRLDFGGQPFDYKPGQAIDIDPHQFPSLAERIRELEQAKGQPEPNRGFSLCSNPLEPGFIEITVKEESSRAVPPLLSPYLVRSAQVGDPIEVQGPYGLYTIPDKLDPAIDCFIHVTAGSGIAPNRGMWRYSLAKGLPVKHAIFCQNKSEDDIIYRRELEELQRANPGRVKIVHALSRTRGEHLSLEILSRDLRGFADPAASMGFVCGPNRPRDGGPGFVESFAGNKRKNQPGILGRLGLPFERIRSELW